jgi:hypothetical protein
MEAKVIENGVAVENESVKPGEYLNYRVVVEGSEDDIVSMRVQKTQHAGALTFQLLQIAQDHARFMSTFLHPHSFRQVK